MLQHELFNENSSTDREKKIGVFFSDNKLSISFDKLILFSIGSLVLFVLIYSFGYERGRSAAEHRLKALTQEVDTIIPLQELVAESIDESIEISVANPVPSSNTSRDEERTASSIAKEIPLSRPSRLAVDGKYTIQVSTILSKERAAIEIKRLQIKGLDAFVVQRGRFYEICIGSFATVSHAKKLLQRFHLEGPYFDAFVRLNPLG